MKLLCTKDLVMLVSQEVQFKAGESYEWMMHADGSVSRVTERGVHLLRSDVWPIYFQYSLEKEHEQLV